MSKLKASEIIEVDDDFIDKVTKRLQENQKEKESLKVYSIKDVSELINRTPQTIHSYIKKGLLIATNPGGGKYTITEQALKDYLKQK
jgi:hypothetical protein